MIDLGCGEGRFSRMLAERGAVVTGVDLCSPFIEFANNHRFSNEAYLIGDMEDLHETPGDEFDLAVSYVTLVDVPDIRSAVGEAFRVLRRGGRFVACNLHTNGLSKSRLDSSRVTVRSTIRSIAISTRVSATSPGGRTSPGPISTAHCRHIFARSWTPGSQLRTSASRHQLGSKPIATRLSATIYRVPEFIIYILRKP